VRRDPAGGHEAMRICNEKSALSTGIVGTLTARIAGSIGVYEDLSDAKLVCVNSSMHFQNVWDANE